MATSAVLEPHPSTPEINGDLQDIGRLIHEEFDEQVDPRVVDDCFTQVAARFDGAKIRSFVPLLVQRYVSAALREHLAHA